VKSRRRGWRRDRRKQFLLVRGRDSELVIQISGTWRLEDGLPSMDAVKKEIERPPHAKSVLFDTRELAGWDSSMVWFLSKASELCRESGIAVDRGRLPKGLRRLVELAEAVPEKKGARRESVAMPFLKRVGNSVIGAISSLRDTQFSWRNGFYLPKTRESPLPSRGSFSLSTKRRPMELDDPCGKCGFTAGRVYGPSPR